MFVPDFTPLVVYGILLASHYLAHVVMEMYCLFIYSYCLVSIYRLVFSPQSLICLTHIFVFTFSSYIKGALYVLLFASLIMWFGIGMCPHTGSLVSRS